MLSKSLNHECEAHKWTKGMLWDYMKDITALTAEQDHNIQRQEAQAAHIESLRCEIDHLRSTLAVTSWADRPSSSQSPGDKPISVTPYGVIHRADCVSDRLRNWHDTALPPVSSNTCQGTNRLQNWRKAAVNANSATDTTSPSNLGAPSQQVWSQWPSRLGAGQIWTRSGRSDSASSYASQGV